MVNLYISQFITCNLKKVWSNNDNYNGYASQIAEIAYKYVDINAAIAKESDYKLI